MDKQCVKEFVLFRLEFGLTLLSSLYIITNSHGYLLFNIRKDLNVQSKNK